MAGVNIKKSLEKVVEQLVNIKAIVITDSDGVVVCSAGNPVRNIGSLAASLAASLPQSDKLLLGPMNTWSFTYGVQRLFILRKGHFFVYIVGAADLMGDVSPNVVQTVVDAHLEPVFEQCELIRKSVLADERNDAIGGQQRRSYS